MPPTTWPCKLLGIDHESSYLRFLSFDGKERTDQLLCGCEDHVLDRHAKSEWCASAGPTGHRAGTLLEAARLYLGSLHDTGQLTDETSDSVRHGLLYPLYCFVVWMTNGVDFKARGRQIPAGVFAQGSWITKIRGEAREFGVPDHMFPSAGVASALADLGTASRVRQGGLTKVTAAQLFAKLGSAIVQARLQATVGDLQQQGGATAQGLAETQGDVQQLQRGQVRLQGQVQQLEQQLAQLQLLPCVLEQEAQLEQQEQKQLRDDMASLRRASVDHAIQPAAATGPAAAPASPTSPASPALPASPASPASSSRTEILTPTITSPLEAAAGELADELVLATQPAADVPGQVLEQGPSMPRQALSPIVEPPSPSSPPGQAPHPAAPLPAGGSAAGALPPSLCTPSRAPGAARQPQTGKSTGVSTNCSNVSGKTAYFSGEDENTPAAN